MLAPLAVELFAGTGSATAGWCALGGRAICFDLEYLPHHGKPHASQHRVIQDVLTLRGSQFRDAAWIWGSPPCQKYSWLAMPWSRSTDPENSKSAKALRKKWETEGPDNRLFDACFRIQREAIEATRTDCRECGVARCLTEIQRCESQLMAGEYPAKMEGLLLGLPGWTRELRLLRAAGCSNCNGEGSKTRYIPLIVENVRGAIPWVGPSKANYGSFHLWGDVEMVGNRIFVGDEWKRGGAGLKVPQRLPKGFGGGWFENSITGAMNPSRNPREFLEAQGSKVPGFRFDGSGRSFQTVETHGIKGIETDRQTLPDGTGGTSWFGAGKRGDPRDVKRDESGAYEMPDGTKIGGDWFSDPNSTCRKHGSRSNARKAASALIAKIPLPLSNYIAQTLYPKGTEHENQPATLRA